MINYYLDVVTALNCLTTFHTDLYCFLFIKFLLSPYLDPEIFCDLQAEKRSIKDISHPAIKADIYRTYSVHAAVKRVQNCYCV